MSPDVTAVPTATLESVAKQFEHWRATRVKKEKIPDALWGLVTPLLSLYNRNEITKALRLNYTQMKERVFHLAPQQQQPAQFIECSLPVASSSTENKVVIEFNSKSGAAVKISGLATDQIQLLISFLVGN